MVKRSVFGNPIETDAVQSDELEVYSCGNDVAAYALYEDDGETKEYSLDRFLHPLTC